MTTIWKYQVPVDDQFTITLPVGARILTVQTQREQPCIWAMVDTNAPTEARRFALRGTDHPCEGLQLAAYVGTFQLRGGSLVFHLFDLGVS